MFRYFDANGVFAIRIDGVGSTQFCNLRPAHGCRRIARQAARITAAECVRRHLRFGRPGHVLTGPESGPVFRLTVDFAAGSLDGDIRRFRSGGTRPIEGNSCL